MSKTKKKSVNRAHTRRFKIPKRPLLRMWLRLQNTAFSIWQRIYNAKLRYKLIGLAVLLVVAEAINIIQPILAERAYAIGNAESLLVEKSEVMASKISYDEKEGAYVFTGGATSSAEALENGKTAVTSTVHKDAKKGIEITDTINQVSFKMIPAFSTNVGRQDGNRIVFPLTNGQSGWLVYSVQGTGIKEDILLNSTGSSELTFEYTLDLGSKLEARMETDGSIGIYGNTLFSSNIATSTDADAALLEKARQNATKTTYLFGIPAPTITESQNESSNVVANYELSGSSLKLHVSNLKAGRYPLSIDPSIYVVTAQQFMAGNNETNINFDVDNKLIKKGRTTGARFNSWTTTSNLPTGEWYGASVGAGGYLYTVGGTAFNGQIFSSQGSGAFTVPSGVTSLTLKMWGGGGGGGGGGSNAAGGAGGGGGYTTATITVTPGETLDVYVGGGGGAGTGFNNNSGYGGGGGGASTVYRSSTPLAIAAGGGGGGGGDSTGGQTGGAGGAGGGDTGGNGGAAGGSGSVNNGGNGGTQSAGGTLGSGGTNPGVIGSSLTGGSGGNGQNSTSGSKGGAANGGLLNGGDGGSRITSSYPGGGGGGAGYFGGAGGNGANTTRGGSGGGGGSSYYTGTGANTAGTGITPGNSTDSYRNGAADGGAAGPADANGTAGDSGLIVVTYSGGLAASQSVNWAKFNTGSGTIDSANPGTGACSGWCTTSAYNLPGARSNFSLVAYNGFLYAMGGLDGSNARQSTVYVAKIGANGEPQLWHPTDSNKNNWVYWYSDAGLSSTRSSFGAVAYNNRMYVVGGLTGAGAGTAVNTTQIANINPNGTLGSWTTSTTLSSPTYGHDVQVYNDRLYVIGGSNSIGGAPSTSIFYNKINNDGSLNSWQPTTPLLNGRMQSGGNFSTIWGAYIYVSGGCGTVNANGYCTNIRSDTQVASINADGSIDVWNTVGGVTDQRMGHSLIAWRDNIYEIGGCDIVSATTGECDILNGLLDTINYGVINPDGEASTVADSVANTLAPCSTLFKGCNLPGVSYIGNVLTGSAIMNGYLYIWGGCSNTTSGCASVSRGVIYTAIGSDGSLTRPASCGSWSVVDSYCYNTTSLPAGFAAPGTAVANGYIYSVGGFNVGGMAGNIYRAAPDPTNGSISSWTATDLTTIGATDVSYTYSFARANPSQAGSVPNNLYIVGGCIGATGVGCPSIGGYTQRVYKCNLDTAGAPSACVWNTQLQIGTVPGADSAGLGAMAGTVYANYIYLMGGLAEGAADLKTTRYAKIDDNNNIVAVSGSAWVESPNQTFYGRRRGSGFGYNGYLYVVGGFDGTGGGSVLADIEFAKINVSDGSIGAWTVSTVSINQRWGLTLTVSNSFAYVIGGCVNGDAPTCASGGQTNSLQTFQVYNNDSGAPAAYSTSANTYGTNPNRIGVSGAISNGYMYVAGGCTGTTDCTSPVTTVSSSPIDVYGGLGSWTNTTALPAARAWGKLLTAGGSLYYIGGQDADGVSQSTVYWATPSGGTISSWSTATNGLPASRTQFGATVWNNRLYVVGGNTGAANQIIYSTAGTSTFTVPTGVTSITVKAWGGGGSGGNGSSGTGSGGNGGGGGFAQADIAVSQGESLTLNVGSGGTKATTASYGGNGGGFSAVLRSGTYLIQAGGGGGGGGTNGTAIAGGVGGPGGGTTAAAGNGTAGGGTTGGGLGGGGITPGGAAGTAGTTGSAGNTGAANLGGDAGGSGATCATVVATRGGNGGTGGGGKGGSSATCVGGGGGGGGAFGGGGGGSAATPTRGGGGGGGASSLVTGSNTVRTVATLQTPGNNTDSTRVTTVGVGGNGSTSTASTAGGSGELVISYSTYTPTATVYVSPQLNSGGNITSAWSTSSTSFDVARSNLTAVAYANNLYILGGHDGANYLSDTQYAQIDSGATVPTNAGLVTGSWTYSESLPKPMAGGDGFATNGYIYLVGGRTDDTTCTPVTLVAPISANTTIATGNNPTGVGVWYETNQRYTGARYGNATVYNDGKAYVIGGGCGVQTTYASPTIQQTALLTQPQVAKYSIMFDTDSDVYPNAWLLNGVDNSIGARWQLKYRSMTNPSAAVQCAASGAMSTWGQETNHGNVTLMLPGAYTPKDASGTNTNCARYFYFNISVDSSQAFGYPDDVSRGPTITDLTLQFTADPAKRLMHGRTFVGGLQMPDDTPYYAH